MIKKIVKMESSWMKKAPTGLSVCILKVLVYIALMIGSYHVYQDCPC